MLKYSTALTPRRQRATQVVETMNRGVVRLTRHTLYKTKSGIDEDETENARGIA